MSEHGITITLPTRVIVWHDAEGRILMTNSGPYEEAGLEKIRTGPQPVGGTILVTELDQIEDGSRPNTFGHYVKNGKVVPRPELIPGRGEFVIVASLNEMPDLPEGSRVTVNDIDEQIMGGPGKPEIPSTGNVVMRVDAFPAKPTVVTIQRDSTPNNVPARLVNPTKRKAKRKA